MDKYFLILDKRFNKIKTLTYLFVFLANVILMPFFSVLEKRASLSIELIYGIIIIFTFYIIHDKFVYFFVFFEIVFYLVLKTFSLKNYFNEKSIAVSDIYGYRLIQIFIFAALLIIIGLTYLKYTLVKEEQRCVNAIEKKTLINDMKNRFLSNMTSEIRTPINSIMGINQLIAREDVDPVIKELGYHIDDSSKHLLKLVNTILEFSKLESENINLYNQRYNFCTLIEGVIDTVSNELAEQDVLFNVSIDPTIPKYLFGDIDRIRQVFMYLLFASSNKNSNSRLSLKITCEKNADNNTATMLCRIAESGNGFSENEIETILSAYSSYDSRLDSEYKRIGLELSICKKILESMDGKLKVESVEGLGVATTFSFTNYILNDCDMISIDAVMEPKTLIYIGSRQVQEIWIDAFKGLNASYRFVMGPNAFRRTLEETEFTHVFIPDEFYDILKDAIESFDIKDRTYVLTDRGHVYLEYNGCRIIHKPLSCINIAEALNGIWKAEKYERVTKSDAMIYPKAKILVVDDSAVNLGVIKAVLKKFEINPDLAQNADDALEYINKSFYDLIVIDQMMPGTNGVELLNIIREMTNTNSKVPIICATADFGPDIGRRLLAEGFQDYLAKPIQLFHLGRILRNYLPDNLVENAETEVEFASLKETFEIQKDALNIDFEYGIENIGGNIDNYCSILNSYYREGIGKIELIQEESIKEDLSRYVIEVHALKSSSASIGAKVISGQFKALEFAGRDNNYSFVNENTSKVLNNFLNVLDLIRKYLQDLNKFEEQNNQNTIIISELEDISVECILEMQSAMKTINLKRCEEIINDLQNRNFGKSVNLLINQIKTSFDMFDYNNVKVKIRELVSLVENKTEDINE